jgi:hypothetical protein
LIEISIWTGNFEVVFVNFVKVVEPLVVQLLLCLLTSDEELVVKLNDVLASLEAVLDGHV